MPQETGVTNISATEESELSSDDENESARIVKHFGKDAEHIYEEGTGIVLGCDHDPNMALDCDASDNESCESLVGTDICDIVNSSYYFFTHEFHF